VPDPYEVSAGAQNDLLEIWPSIASELLGRMPGQGHSRKDLTARPVLFFPLYSFLIVYQPATKPIRIMAVLRAKRDMKRILQERL